MESSCQYISFESTGYFSKLVADYLNGSELLKPFYNYPVSIQGIKESIKARQSFNTNRVLLVDELRKQYSGIPFSAKQEQYLQSLLSKDTFTVTTAHQPNIFTGPLYFIYKILHTIKLADELNTQLPEHRFVPFYYMGSEDADLDELGYIILNGQKLIWKTAQTGAVGRMKVDKEFVKLIEAIHGQIGIHPYGKELSDLFKQSYSIGKTVQQATLELVNALFADYGLLILIPDNALLKQSFNNVVEKELTEQFSHKAVEETIRELGKHYKVQTGGREINLFYLIDDKRERIQGVDPKTQKAVDTLQDPRCNLNDSENKSICKGQETRFQVKSIGLEKEWSEEEMFCELKEHPERFSANVILRGVFQETVLPNIVFIGGGGELAYWLELKKVFEAVQVPYPMLLMRNSFLLMHKQQVERFLKLGFSLNDLFKKEDQLLNELVQKESGHQVRLNGELDNFKDFYQHIQTLAGNIDPTLQKHAEALQTKAFKQLLELEKKMLRAEKRKYETQQRQIVKLKQELFPSGSLQERTENFALEYAVEGKQWLQLVYDASPGLEQQFTIITSD